MERVHVTARSEAVDAVYAAARAVLGLDRKGKCYCDGPECGPCSERMDALRAALALPREEGPRCAACGGNWFNAVGGCVRCCLSAGAAAAAYALTTAPPPPQPTERSET
jgi:hypothetical protein